MDSRDKSAGISYRDVAVVLKEVARTHNGHAWFSIHLPVSSGSPHVLMVRCAFLPRDIAHRLLRHEVGVNRPWPSNIADTFAGLLMLLAYELDAHLSRSDWEKQDRASGQDRLPF